MSKTDLSPFSGLPRVVAKDGLQGLDRGPAVVGELVEVLDRSAYALSGDAPHEARRLELAHVVGHDSNAQRRGGRDIAGAGLPFAQGLQDADTRGMRERLGYPGRPRIGG